MHTLNQLIDSLNQDILSAVSVFDKDLAKFVVRNKTQPEIISQHSTAENFFEELYANGHKNLKLTLKQKEGSGFKTVYEFDSTFGAPNQPPKTNEMMPQQPTVHAAQPMQNSEFGMFGLGALDIMNLVSDSRDAKRLQMDNEFLKRENIDVKKENDRIKEEQMLAKYTREGKEANQQMLAGAIQSIPAIIQLVKGGDTEGLNAAQPAYSTDVKTNFASKLNDTPDSTLQVLESIAGGITNNPNFTAELATLLKKHQLMS